MTNSERLGHVLVALPIAHVLGSTLFMWSYCTGFGGHIVAFASATDLISVSLSDMVPVYVVSLLVPFLTVGFRLSGKYPYVINAVDSISDPDEKTKAANFHRNVRKVVFGVCWVVSFLVFGKVIYDLYEGYRVNFMGIWVASFIPALFALMAFCESRQVSNVVYEASAVMLSFVSAIFFTAAAKGQDDRYRYFTESIEEYGRCGEFLIIRPISDNFIAVSKGDGKFIINNDCKPIFQIPKASRKDPHAPSRPQSSAGPSTPAATPIKGTSHRASP